MSHSQFQTAFSTRVPGKWVLAGEHAVLRGATAIALPHPGVGLKLSFEPARDGGFRVEPSDAQAVIEELVEAVGESREAEGHSFKRPSGTLRLESTIPIGAGLGSSAALCVSMTRWLGEELRVPRSEWLEFATQLEHRFHGRSSGMDVAVISANEPVSYVMGRGARPLGVKKVPHFTFHDTGIRTRTSECIVRVERFREDDPALAMRIDEQMGEASRHSMEGLFAFDRGEKDKAHELIAQGMKLAQECFLSWQLVPGEARRIAQDLERQGSLAVKLTGAGGGGMLVALWEKET